MRYACTMSKSAGAVEEHQPTAKSEALAAVIVRRLTKPLGGQQLQPKTYIELAAAMRAATGQTSDCAFDLADAREIAPTIRATVNETPRITLRRKRQRMTALLVCDSQIAASLLPLGSVR